MLSVSAASWRCRDIMGRIRGGEAQRSPGGSQLLHYSLFFSFWGARTHPVHMWMLRSLAVTLVRVVNTSCHKHCNCHITVKHNEELDGQLHRVIFLQRRKKNKRTVWSILFPEGGPAICNSPFFFRFVFFKMVSQYFWWEEVNPRQNLSHESRFGVFACCVQGRSEGV